MDLGGIARAGAIAARAAVKDRRPPQAARASPSSSLTASTARHNEFASKPALPCPRSLALKP